MLQLTKYAVNNMSNNKKIHGVILTKWGASFLPDEEYEKKGLKRLTRNSKNIIPVGKELKNGDSIFENAVYYPDKEKIVIEINL